MNGIAVGFVAPQVCSAARKEFSRSRQVDAEEALEAAKTSRAVAHVNAAQAKIRLALLRNGKLAGGTASVSREPEDGRPPPFVSDAKIMEGTPEDLVPYQTMLAKEYHAASVALKTGPPAAE